MGMRAVAAIFVACATAASAADEPNGENPAYNSGEHSNAVRKIKKKADRGRLDALVQLAEMYYTGLGVPQDYKEAARWLRLAADRKEPVVNILANTNVVAALVARIDSNLVQVAQCSLGTMYHEGKGEI